MPDVPSSNHRTGGQIIVDCLRLHGVNTVFACRVRATWRRWTLSMTSKKKLNLWFVDKKAASPTWPRLGEMTGKPGIGFVTRGPGATNASIGIHTAQQDSTPLDFIHWSNSP